MQGVGAETFVFENLLKEHIWFCVSPICVIHGT